MSNLYLQATLAQFLAKIRISLRYQAQNEILIYDICAYEIESVITLLKCAWIKISVLDHGRLLEETFFGFNYRECFCRESYLCGWSRFSLTFKFLGNDLAMQNRTE